VSDEIKKSKGIKFETDKLERARSYEAKLQELGIALIGSLHTLVRNVKLYGPENAIFEKPLEKVRDNINTIFAIDGKLNLQSAGNSFYLNDMLLRIENKNIESIRYLNEEFERCDVGGFSLDKSVNIQELQNFIFIFSNENQETASESGVSSRELKSFKIRSYKKVREILEHQEDVGKFQDAKLDRKRYALIVYARLVHFMQLHLDGLRGLGQEIPMVKSKQLVQDLVDVCFEYKQHFLGLTTAEIDEDSLPFHCANVAVLSVVFGIELGLNKERLLELGTAALFHDIGKVDIDPLLLAKREGWTEEESKEMSRAPYLTVKRLLQARHLDLSNMHNIVVAFEHQVPFGKPIKNIEGKIVMVEPVVDLAVYTRIIAIVECYESLTHQFGRGSDEALKLMSSEWKFRFDPVYMNVFVKMLKGLAARILSDEGKTISFVDAPQQ